MVHNVDTNMADWIEVWKIQQHTPPGTILTFFLSPLAIGLGDQPLGSKLSMLLAASFHPAINVEVSEIPRFVTSNNWFKLLLALMACGD